MHRCAFCRYDLAGQTTFYVEQYHLTAVRCPECGRAQPADPALAPEKRLRAMFRWVGLLRLPAAVLIAIGTAATIAGIAQSAAYVGTEPAAAGIQAAAPRARMGYYSSWKLVPTEWWAGYRDEFEAGDGTNLWSLQWDGDTEWVWLAPVIPTAAVLLVLLLGSARPRFRRAVLCSPVFLSMIGLGVYFLAQPISYVGNAYTGFIFHTGEIATDRYGKGVAWASVGVGVALYWLCVNIAFRQRDRLIALLSKRRHQNRNEIATPVSRSDPI